MRKKSLKCFVALFLAMTMFATACGATEETKAPENDAVVDEPANEETSSEEEAEVLEPVHLVLYMNQVTGADDEKVAAAVNELQAVKDLNVTVEFVTIPEGDDFYEKVGLELASGADIDIVVGEIDSTYKAHADEGAYADISELLNTKYTKLKETIPEDLWAASTRTDGGIYCVPTIKETSSEWGFYIQRSVVEKYGIDLSAERRLTDITDILENLRDDGRATFHFNYAGIGSLRVIDASVNHANVAASYGASVRLDDPSKIINYYASEDYKNLCLKTREWYQNGLIDADILTRENYTAEFNDADLFGLEFTMHAPFAEYVFASNWGMDVDFLKLAPSTYSPGVGFATCINAKSDNIDRALAFIEVWNTNAEVKNTITYGIEGEHYDLVDGQVDWTAYPDHLEKWHGNNSMLGNNLIAYTPVGYPEKDYSIYAREAEAARANPAAGFALDDSKISNEIAAVVAVITEYSPLLCSGTAEDVEGTLAEFLEKLDANGLQKIIDEVQAQWDVFYKK